MSDDVEWLTIDEAAARLGISRESVRRTALRKRWAKRPGNDGRVRLGVPIERLPSAPAVGQDTGQTAGQAVGPDAGQGVGPAVGQPDARVAILLAEIEGLKLLVGEAGKRADAAERRADEIRQDREVQVAALDALLTELRQDRDHWRKAAMERRSWWPFRRAVSV